MRNILVAVTTFAVLIPLAAPLGARSRASGPQSSAAAEALKLPPFKKVRTANGMTLLLMEQHEIPLASFSFIVRAGSVADPAGREGSVALVADMLRKGTKGRTSEQFADQLDFIGGQFEVNAGRDFTSGSAEFLSKDMERGLDLLADALMRPVFPQEEFDKRIRERLDEIKAAKDQAQAVIGAYFQRYLFAGHTYGRPVGGTETSVAAIRRDNLTGFYAAHYTPGNIILAACGDFRAEEMARQLEAKFGAWEAIKAPQAALAAPAPYRGRKLLLVDKPDSTQTVYRIGNVGIARTNPDRVHVDIINTLFGGRFTSMLNSELRIKNGLTYGANSRFDRGAVPGSFQIATYTRNESTEKAIDLTLEVARRLQEKGVSAEELASAKNYMKGQFPPRIETTSQLADLIAELEFFGLAEDEITQLFARIDSMTPEKAREIIGRYFLKDDLVFVLIGKADEIRNAVKKYAPQMDEKKISDPGY